MKLNQNTIDTLKNFAGINTNILIKQGDELSTISTMRNIFAKAKVSDNFTNEFGIYDLNEFLSAVSGFAKPELSLQEKYMTISSEGSKSKVKYFYSDPSVIVSPTLQSDTLLMPELINPISPGPRVSTSVGLGEKIPTLSIVCVAPAAINLIF